MILSKDTFPQNPQDYRKVQQLYNQEIQWQIQAKEEAALRYRSQMDARKSAGAAAASLPQSSNKTQDSDIITAATKQKKSGMLP